MIETKDLILHSGSPDDWEELYNNLWCRAEVFCFLFSKPSPDKTAAQNRTAAYAQMHTEEKTEFFVYDKKSHEAIGIAGIKRLHCGYWTITDIAIGPDFHGRGYGKQIVEALIHYAFSNTDATEISYSCFTQNTISKKLAISCGFVFSHSEEAELLKNGEKVILDYYTISK